MSNDHSTGRSKPIKPYPDFPLFPHAAGQWAKKIRGKLHYFGVWTDPQAALNKYLAEKDARHAGRKPKATADEVLVRDVANAFLNAKRALLESGELSPHTFANYKRATDTLIAHLGRTRLVADLDADDFATRWRSAGDPIAWRLRSNISARSSSTPTMPT